MKHLLSISSLTVEQIVEILNLGLLIKGSEVHQVALDVFKGKHVVIVGDILHSRVAHSNLELITKLGGRVTFVGPGTLMPANLLGLPDVQIEYDFDKVLQRNDFHAIMLLRIQAERMLGNANATNSVIVDSSTDDSLIKHPDKSMHFSDVGFFPSLEEYVLGYALTNERIAKVAPEVPILHPAPINRGLEISSEIADSPRSLINRQIHNGVFLRMSCLLKLFGQSYSSNALNGKTICNLFYENSTRTRFSFEVAEKKLGARVMNFSPSGSSVAKGESIKDTVTTLYALGIDAIVIRHQHSGAAHRLANSGWVVDVPVINAGDGTHAHPTQALLDAMTLVEYFSQ